MLFPATRCDLSRQSATISEIDNNFFKSHRSHCPQIRHMDKKNMGYYAIWTGLAHKNYMFGLCAK
jgi:hypothetical protein